ncbi:MAG: pentapeptide repeat-containing protein [Paracoccaceae bacterium]|nr:pentapeptide repeat-containing protein [Paracoccaceae bacterium]
MDSGNSSEGSDTSKHTPETRKRLENEAEVLSGSARRQLFVLIFAGFFLMLTLSVPDSQLVRADATINWPLIQTQIQLSTFVTFAPLALIALLAYLHLLFGRLLKLRQEGFSPPEIDILAMTSRPAQLLANAMLYLFVPFVLAWFSWKVVFRDEARFLIAATFIVTLASTVLYLRRSRSGVDSRSDKMRRIGIGITVALSLLGASLMLPWSDIKRIAPGLPQLDWRNPVMKLRMLDLKRANLGSVDEFAIVNLASQDLRYADARYARLIGADLRDSNLTRANFRYALIGSDGSGTSMVTDFERAVLNRASIEQADLRNTHFDHASLVGADLEQVVLGDTRFWCADLSGAMMNRVTGEGGNIVFQHARLDSAQLGRAELSRPNFRYTSLVGADLGLANIEGGQFGFADLSAAQLGNGQFRNTSFFEAKLENADLSYADFEGADFSGANLTGANFTGAYGIEWSDVARDAFLCRTIGSQGKTHNDHCSVVQPETSSGEQSNPSGADATLHPCQRTQNTGNKSFLLRMLELFADEK